MYLLAVLCTFVPLAPQDDARIQLRHAPRPGLALERTSRFEMDLGLERSDATFERVGPIGEDMQLDVRDRHWITVRDTYADDGALRREFVGVGSDAFYDAEIPKLSDSNSGKTTFTSSLVGRSVVWAPGGEGGTRFPRFDPRPEAHEDQRLLAGLVEDMDLAGVLPEGAVAPGDTWEVDGPALAGLLAAGGRHHTLPENWRNTGSQWFVIEGGLEDPAEVLGPLGGGGLVTFRGVSTVDGGPRVAVLDLVIGITSERDITARYQEQCAIRETLPDEAGIPIVFAPELAQLGLGFEASGTLRWNLDENVLHGLALKGTLRLTLDARTELRFPPGSRRLEQHYVLSGPASVTVEAAGI